ncbi:hypothetical protein DFO70_11777 [Cytobacillus firmus]|uniref:Uncharacterized protein n=2 Tax=Cytobacillus TaxID=2675230 RepID=A0A366JLX3_CYTFI|nr:MULTISPECIES: hypothetical protein [Cytobacillus]RBP87886.1 hypothetical protein DFO70_11777 [Cytobacillus firmus]TDX39249.1 hypothetical protein DFO72_11179 [Cytobacillus oceanisediminis]
MEQMNQQINIDPYVQSEMGRLNYENIILKARLDHAVKQNQELLQKVQELEEKLIESKENKKAKPKN